MEQNYQLFIFESLVLYASVTLVSSCVIIVGKLFLKSTPKNVDLLYGRLIFLNSELVSSSLNHHNYLSCKHFNDLGYVF